MTVGRAILCLSTMSLLSTAAGAQQPEEIVVVGVVPSGAGVERDKIPYPVQSADSEALENVNALGIADFLKLSFGSVALNDAQNNPLQPDLQYRGFTLSPLLGLAQGMAVYQNGVRINEPLGDAVNWDLLPQSAIAGITLSGGATPLFGLNSLGGSLAIDMKDGFGFQGAGVEVSAGSFGRVITSVEVGGNNGTLGYYANIEYFDEDGWRDHSSSDALNFYGSLGWRTDASQVNLNYQYGKSELTGNGASPVELIAINREFIFTGPDITENDMHMVSVDFHHQATASIGFGGNVFFRRNDTDSFNGDGSEFGICGFGGMATLIEGPIDDGLEELGLDHDDVCGSQFGSANALEAFLNDAAGMPGGDDRFNIDAFGPGELSGSGVLSDEAINNISHRVQESSGGDFQWALLGNILDIPSQIILGGAYFKGESDFNARLELADIDPLTRLTTGLGTGTFVDGGATLIDTETESISAYVTVAMDLSDDITLTLSARGNATGVDLRDQSGERPELNGNHSFNRVNPAIGLTWQARPDHNLYFSYSESNRAPTPIELTCNEGVFDLAVAFAIQEGEDPDDVDFECRLPNAFLADPPLDDVVARNFELGARGFIGELNYSLGVFNTVSKDDILFQTTGRSTGLFANVDETRRRGVEVSLRGRLDRLSWFTAYSYIEATFEDDFLALSPNHDFASEAGEIAVQRGDEIPGIPKNQFKFGADYRFAEALSIGLDLVGNSGQHLRGDESNQLDKIDGYTVINLRARYHVGDDFEIFARVDNLLDKDYETFGLLGEEPGEVDLPIIEDLTIPRFLGAAPPRAGFVGLRYRF